LNIINSNDERYVVCGTVLENKVTNLSTEELKSRYHLADTVLRNGDTLYICSKIIEGEFEEIPE
tara:strand:- start:4548 stop:4739 length:192 start_codon:yes stop_codon:yes gene_type:complete